MFGGVGGIFGLALTCTGIGAIIGVPIMGAGVLGVASGVNDLKRYNQKKKYNENSFNLFIKII